MCAARYGQPLPEVHPHDMRTTDRIHRAFFRQWRLHRHLTLEALAERIGMTHASVSRIERGLQKWDQEFLERAADALSCEPADLLVRDPSDPDGIWSLWDQAEPGTRKQIVEITKTLLKKAS